MTGVEVGEHLLATGLGAVVELLGDPFPQLREQRGDILARRDDPEQPAQQGDVAEVGLDGLGDARVLHLDRDRAAITGDRAVHLPDRGSGDGLGIPGRKRPLRRQAQLLGDDLRGQCGAHRAGAVLQAAERAPGGRGQALVDVTGHLAELHQHALHGAQRGGDVFGGLQGQVVAQLFPVLARGGEQPRGVARVPRAAARGQQQCRHPALGAQFRGTGMQHGPGRGRRAAERRRDGPRARCHQRRGADPQREPLPCLEHAWLAEDGRVEHAERLADLRPAAGRQPGSRRAAVHVPRPVRQGGRRGDLPATS